MPQEKCGHNRLCTPSHAYAAVHRASNKIPTLLLPGEHFWDGMLMLASIASRKATPENPLESSPTSYTDTASEERGDDDAHKGNKEADNKCCYLKHALGHVISRATHRDSGAGFTEI